MTASTSYRENLNQWIDYLRQRTWDANKNYVEARDNGYEPDRCAALLFFWQAVSNEYHRACQIRVDFDEVL